MNILYINVFVCIQIIIYIYEYITISTYELCYNVYVYCIGSIYDEDGFHATSVQYNIMYIIRFISCPDV